MDFMKNLNKTLMIIWGVNPPTQGGAAGRMFRVTNYISNYVKINLITKKAKKSNVFEKSKNISLFRLPPSDLKADKSNLSYGFHKIFKKSCLDFTSRHSRSYSFRSYLLFG